MGPATREAASARRVALWACVGLWLRPATSLSAPAALFAHHSSPLAPAMQPQPAHQRVPRRAGDLLLLMGQRRTGSEQEAAPRSENPFQLGVVRSVRPRGDAPPPESESEGLQSGAVAA